MKKFLAKWAFVAASLVLLTSPVLVGVLWRPMWVLGGWLFWLMVAWWVPCIPMLIRAEGFLSRKFPHLYCEGS